jgi:hypothetical protein
MTTWLMSDDCVGLRGGVETIAGRPVGVGPEAGAGSDGSVAVGSRVAGGKGVGVEVRSTLN